MFHIHCVDTGFIEQNMAGSFQIVADCKKVKISRSKANSVGISTLENSLIQDVLIQQSQRHPVYGIRKTFNRRGFLAFSSDQKFTLSDSTTNGRPRTRRNMFPMYSPITPNAINCMAPRKKSPIAKGARPNSNESHAVSFLMK
jgi:hypothetical protein